MVFMIKWPMPCKILRLKASARKRLVSLMNSVIPNRKKQNIVE